MNRADVSKANSSLQFAVNGSLIFESGYYRECYE
jgi:hypothetical protein